MRTLSTHSGLALLAAAALNLVAAQPSAAAVPLPSPLGLREAPPKAWEGVTQKAESKLRYFLPTGFTFPGRLQNAVYSYNTETPGIAVVERDIEYLGRVVVPAKTRVIGTVSVLKSHDRALLRFHTMVFPDGSEIRLMAMALSLDGSAGLRGKVEKHKDAAVANTVLRSVVAGAGVALDAAAGNPIALSAAQGVSQDALRELDLERQQVTTSISVEAETGLLIYISQRLEY